MGTRAWVTTCLLAVLLLTACSTRPTHTTARAVPVTPPVPLSRPTTVPPSAAAPGWRYRQYELQGSYRVHQHTGDVALLSQRLLKPGSDQTKLYLLDLSTGATRILRDRAVGPDVVITGYGLGEGWAAWEEICENDTDVDPANVVWKLYVAPYDARTLSAGSPRCVDSAVLKARSRPLFAFSGSKLFIGTTKAIGTDGDARAGTGEVRVVDLRSTDDSGTLLTLDTPISYTTVSEGNVIITRPRSKVRNEKASCVEVYDCDSGRLLRRFEPPRPGTVSHSGAYHAGRFAWAEITPGEGGDTSVFMAEPGAGKITALSFSGGDIGMAGDWVVAEASEPNTESVRTQSYAPGAEIYVMPLRGGTRGLLVDGLIAKGQMWQIAAPPVYHADRVVLYADGAQFEGDGKTRVRVYEVPSGTAVERGD